MAGKYVLAATRGGGRAGWNEKKLMPIGSTSWAPAM
jgi:hypothetical protein